MGHRLVSMALPRRVIAPAQQHIPFGTKFLQNAAGEKIGSTPVLLYWMVDNHLLQQKPENGVANTSLRNSR